MQIPFAEAALTRIRGQRDLAVPDDLDLYADPDDTGAELDADAAPPPSTDPTLLLQKMEKRHPWLYGDAPAREPWEQMKSKTRRSLADGLPAGLPSLHRAHRLQERAAGVGFDWPDVAGPAAKVREEAEELFAELERAGRPAPETEPDRAVEAEVGDLLFTVVNLARFVNVDPELALRGATGRFRGRG